MGVVLLLHSLRLSAGDGCETPVGPRDRGGAPLARLPLDVARRMPTSNVRSSVSNGTPQLRIAFVGAGAMARVHLQALRHVPTTHRVVGVCDVSTAAARDFARDAGPGATAHATLAA